MRGMPFSLQGKGVIQIGSGPAPAPPSSLLGVTTNTSATATKTNSSHQLLWSTCSSDKEGVEPRSVLDHRRSPSPPTSTSTLSSSFGGGSGGSTDSAGVAAVSDNPLQKWPGPPPQTQQPSQHPTAAASAPAALEEGVGRKEEWASELQPIPVELGLMGAEKCGGLGVEDWESMLSETPAVAAVSPGGHDHSLLRWIMGETGADDSSGVPHKLQHHQQHLMSQSSMAVAGDFDAPASLGGGSGFGLIDPGFGFELIGGGFGGGGGPNPIVDQPSMIASAGGFSFLGCSNNSGGSNNRMLLTPASSSSAPNTQPSCFGNNPTSIFPLTVPSPAVTFPQAMFYQEHMEEKAQLFSHNSFLVNHQQAQTPPQNPAFFLPLTPFSQPEHQQQQQQQHFLLQNSKRHHSMPDLGCQIDLKVPFSDSAQDLFLRRHQPQLQSFGGLQANCYNIQQRPVKANLGGEDEASVAAVAATAAAQQQLQQQQALRDQLFKAAELIEAGNSVNARGILARLNHQLSPHGKPLLRSAFYFKEALSTIVANAGNNGNLPPLSSPKPLTTPLDVVFKLSAYKAFSDISPVLQFTNFTCTQVLLEELGGCSHIHIIDFDIGIGGQWSSFMQELSQRRCSAAAAPPQLKITVFVKPSSHHPLELHLTKENLSHFASELNIPFEFHAMSLDSFDPAMILNMSPGYNAGIAVNVPVGSSNSSMPEIIRLVKQLSPKIVVSVDHGSDRSDLSFSQHFRNALNSYTVLLESIDASGTSTSMDAASKIEKFLLQPRIEDAVLGRYHATDKVIHWGTMFTSAGFMPLPFSNFTEMQAECLLKRIQVRGFHVEKLQSSLLLLWQHGELVSVSAWKC